MIAVTPTPSTGEKVFSFAVKWTPRAIAVAIGGYYGLGIAYELGLMASIDQIAIQILKSLGGYVGIGALMPTVQWYSAWSARILIGLTVGLVYDLTERVIKACWNRFSPSSPETAIAQV